MGEPTLKGVFLSLSLLGVNLMFAVMFAGRTCVYVYIDCNAIMAQHLFIDCNDCSTFCQSKKFGYFSAINIPIYVLIHIYISVYISK